jgi:hypothetical protein
MPKEYVTLGQNTALQYLWGRSCGQGGSPELVEPDALH